MRYLHSFMGTQSSAPTNKIVSVCKALLDQLAPRTADWINVLLSCHVKTEDIPNGKLYFILY